MTRPQPTNFEFIGVSFELSIIEGGEHKAVALRPASWPA
jgi:hypothetical protein